MPAKIAGYNDFVFINCPFDEEYMPLLHALVYSICRCGFVPQCALGEDDGSDGRLDKIIRCIKNCRYGIHDISRIETNTHNLPRFNMPFELGVFFGAKRFGVNSHKSKMHSFLKRQDIYINNIFRILMGLIPKHIITILLSLFEK
jgi:hypothetical protein